MSRVTFLKGNIVFRTPEMEDAAESNGGVVKKNTNNPRDGLTSQGCLYVHSGAKEKKNKNITDLEHYKPISNPVRRFCARNCKKRPFLSKHQTVYRGVSASKFYRSLSRGMGFALGRWCSRKDLLRCYNPNVTIDTWKDEPPETMWWPS